MDRVKHAHWFELEEAGRHPPLKRYEMAAIVTLGFNLRVYPENVRLSPTGLFVRVNPQGSLTHEFVAKCRVARVNQAQASVAP